MTDDDAHERRQKLSKPRDRKIFEGFMDAKAVETAQRLRAKGLYDELGSPIKEGKESIILRAVKEGQPRILKVYKIETSKFENMSDYLEGDPRFSRIKPVNKRALIYTWTRKEYANLKRAHAAGVRCPEPFGFLNNMIIMSFIGDEDPAPLLKDVQLEDAQQTFDELVEQYKKLYKAGLVHADFSEYNILVHDGVPWLIDFAQASLRAHPKADEFFERDVQNIVNYFKKKYDLEVNLDDTKNKIQS